MKNEAFILEGITLKAPNKAFIVSCQENCLQKQVLRCSVHTKGLNLYWTAVQMYWLLLNDWWIIVWVYSLYTLFYLAYGLSVFELIAASLHHVTDATVDFICPLCSIEFY